MFNENNRISTPYPQIRTYAIFDCWLQVNYGLQFINVPHVNVNWHWELIDFGWNFGWSEKKSSKPIWWHIRKILNIASTLQLCLSVKSSFFIRAHRISSVSTKRVRGMLRNKVVASQNMLSKVFRVCRVFDAMLWYYILLMCIFAYCAAHTVHHICDYTCVVDLFNWYILCRL